MVKLDEATSVKYGREDAGSKFRGLDIAAGGGGGGTSGTIQNGTEDFSQTTTSNQMNRGWEFTVSEAVEAKGLRIISPGEHISLRLSEDTTLIGSVELESWVTDEWSEGLFEEPILLETGKNYRIWVYSDEETIYYMAGANLVFDPDIITFVQGRYDSTPSGPDDVPGSINASTAYGLVDLVI